MKIAKILKRFKQHKEDFLLVDSTNKDASITRLNTLLSLIDYIPSDDFIRHANELDATLNADLYFDQVIDCIGNFEQQKNTNGARKAFERFQFRNEDNILVDDVIDAFIFLLTKASQQRKFSLTLELRSQKAQFMTFEEFLEYCKMLLKKKSDFRSDVLFEAIVRFGYRGLNEQANGAVLTNEAITLFDTLMWKNKSYSELKTQYGIL